LLFPKEELELITTKSFSYIVWLLASLYFVLDPLIQPTRNFMKLPIKDLAQIDAETFIAEVIIAIDFAARIGRNLKNYNTDHFFVSEHGRPVFIGLCDENYINFEKVSFSFNLLLMIFSRFIEAAEWRGGHRPAARLKEHLKKLPNRLCFEFDVQN